MTVDPNGGVYVVPMRQQSDTTGYVAKLSTTLTGPLFRVMNRHGQVLEKGLSAEGVALVVKRYVVRLGYDPAAFAGHSLRAGLATSAAAAGKSERAIMNQSGHRSVTIVRRYIRDGNLFRENAAEGLGL
jgi:integrase